MNREKETVVDNRIKRYMAKNLDTGIKINNIINHKIKYYYELKNKGIEEKNEKLLDFIDSELEKLKKDILKLTYDNYRNVIIDDYVFDFLYEIYGDNKEAVKILDDMKMELCF